MDEIRVARACSDAVVSCARQALRKAETRDTEGTLGAAEVLESAVVALEAVTSGLTGNVIGLAEGLDEAVRTARRDRCHLLRDSGRGLHGTGTPLSAMRAVSRLGDAARRIELSRVKIGSLRKTLHLVR